MRDVIKMGIIDKLFYHRLTTGTSSLNANTRRRRQRTFYLVQITQLFICFIFLFYVGSSALSSTSSSSFSSNIKSKSILLGTGTKAKVFVSINELDQVQIMEDSSAAADNEQEEEELVDRNESNNNNNDHNNDDFGFDEESSLSPSPLLPSGEIVHRRTRSYAYSYERRIPHQRAEEGPPKIQPTITNVQAVVGSNVTLECFIESYPKSVNYWMMGSERLWKDTNKFKISDEPINLRNFEYRDRLRLHIINVDGNDYGATFRCFSTNEYGTNYKGIRIEGHKPIIETMHNETTVESAIGSDFILECIISAVPDGINYWTYGSDSPGKPDQRINSNSKFSITQHSYNSNLYQTITRLRVNDVQNKDFTTYKCKSKNRNGEDEKTFKVIKSGYVLPKRAGVTSSSSYFRCEINIQFKLLLILLTSLLITELR